MREMKSPTHAALLTVAAAEAPAAANSMWQVLKSSIFAVSAVSATLVLGAASVSHADTSSDLDSLGSNRQIVRRAQALESQSRVGVVQGRTVDRNWRLEIGGNYGPVAAGDSYLNTQNLGAQVDLHITPQFSLGVRYEKAFSSLTQEGQNQFQAAQAARQAGGDFRIPDIDPPKSSLLAVANWYMFYGKMNFFDLSVVQFDIYSLAGYGQMTLQSGTTPTWTAGGGIGFWLTQHLTSRFEIRYQNYTDQVYTGSRSLNLIAANLGFGVLL